MTKMQLYLTYARLLAVLDRLADRLFGYSLCVGRHWYSLPHLVPSSRVLRLPKDWERNPNG